MSKTDRRSFIAKAGLLGLTALSGSALLTACGGGAAENSTETSPKPAPAPAPAEETPAAAETNTAAVDCSEHNQNLAESDLQVRESVAYIDQTENAEQKCTNCRFYQADKFAGACGGCMLFANGAVNPEGWCKSWAAKDA